MNWNSHGAVSGVCVYTLNKTYARMHKGDNGLIYMRQSEDDLRVDYFPDGYFYCWRDWTIYQAPGYRTMQSLCRGSHTYRKVEYPEILKYLPALHWKAKGMQIVHLQELERTHLENIPHYLNNMLRKLPGNSEIRSKLDEVQQYIELTERNNAVASCLTVMENTMAEGTVNTAINTVAVKFKGGYATNKLYHYLTNDLDIKVGDSVVVASGLFDDLAVAVVEQVFKAVQTPRATKWVVQRVNIEAHQQRLNDIQRAKELKKALDKRLAAKQRENQYSLLLDNPVDREMVEELKQLQRIYNL